MYKLDLEKAEAQRSNCQHPWDHRKSKRIPEKYPLLLTDYAKAFGCVDHNKLWKILKEMVIPDHLTSLLRNLYAGQEATDRSGYGTRDQPWDIFGRNDAKAETPVLWPPHAKG